MLFFLFEGDYDDAINFRWRENFFGDAKIFEKLDRVVAIDFVQKWSKSELSSRFSMDSADSMDSMDSMGSMDSMDSMGSMGSVDSTQTAVVDDFFSREGTPIKTT